MSSWYSSWFSGFPNIDFTLPSVIQRRFVSFVLKKALGHLLRPGQLDVHQIDSQIGSGFVQVKDLELDSEAINGLLTGLPLALHDGSIACITARVPWPNPLTSSVGLSVQSLHLIFHVVAPTVQSPFQANRNLSDSVASVAETFIHHELTPREEAALRERLNPSVQASDLYEDDEQTIPGGLNPFIDTLSDENHHSDVDPSGVSLFASLFERLLARFEFDAVDAKLTIIYPGHSSFTLSVAEVRYSTESRDDGHSNPSDSEKSRNNEDGNLKRHGHIRIMGISGVKMTYVNLYPQTMTSPSSLTPPAFPPDSPSHRVFPASPPISSSSSSSSLDEDTHLMMSQSLISLPRPRSPMHSVMSSMYQSALSTVPEHGGLLLTGSPKSQDSHHGSPRNLISTEHSIDNAGDDVVLSFGPEPIQIRLETPVRHRSLTVLTHTTLAEDHSQDTAEAQIHAPDTTFKLSVAAGALACALRARHVRALMDILELCASHSPSSPSAPNSAPPSNPTSSDSPFSKFGLQAAFKSRGVVILLLPASLDAAAASESPGLQGIADFFAHPLIPPKLSHGYLRIFLDTFSGSLYLPDAASQTPNALVASDLDPQMASLHKSSRQIQSDLTLSDLSIFAFRAVDPEGELYASPVLIIDHYLPSQYPSNSAHRTPTGTSHSGMGPNLPAFDVIDWTDKRHQTFSAKISTWRAKLKSKVAKRATSTPQHSPNVVGINLSPSPKPISGLRIAEGPDDQHTSLPPALLVSFQKQLSTVHSTGSFHALRLTDELKVTVGPLHFFLDLGLMLEQSDLLDFLEEVSNQPSELFTSRDEVDDGLSSDEHDEDGEDSSTWIRTRFVTDQQRQREAERKRLEKLVIDDLDLTLDYRAKDSFKGFESGPKSTLRKRKAKDSRGAESRVTVNVSIPMIRIEIRCSPPPLRQPRSGALIFDVGEIKISNDARHDVQSTSRLTSSISPNKLPMNPAVVRSELLHFQCRRIVLAYSLRGETKAIGVLSCGSLSSGEQPLEALPTVSEDASPLLFSSGSSPLPLRMCLSRTLMQSSSRSTSIKTTMVIDIPSVIAVVTKPAFDGLQQWADDVAQIMQRALSVDGDTDTAKAGSREPSIIGSRFFAKTRAFGSRSSGESRSSRTHSGTDGGPKVETVFNITISEAFIRLMLLPSHADQNDVHPLDISSSDMDITLELQPGGKEMTVISAALMDLSVTDVSSNDIPIAIFSLSAPRSLSSTPKPMVAVRFTSLVIPQTTAKQSKISLTLWGFTYYLYPKFQWVRDLSTFLKAPPGVFESVVPSERTLVTVNIMDGSIYAVAPGHAGVSLLRIGKVDFSTELVGGSNCLSFGTNISAISLLLLDALPPTGRDDEGRHELDQIKAAGYALIAELDVDLNVKLNNSSLPPDFRVVGHNANLRIYLCADTLAALIAFIGSLSSAFSPTDPDPSTTPRTKKGPSTVITGISSSQGLMGSIDEQAFRQIPELGPSADMIYDDLPRNLDYLDASFGAAAGLRELRDDDLDDFFIEETKNTSLTEQSIGVVSNVGGETVKVIRPLQIIENYYDTLPSDSEDDSSDYGETTVRVRLHDCNVVLFLHDGYDWSRTRATIEKEVKEVRRRLAKIRQLVATGQTPDPHGEETSALLFNSIYVGLEQDVDDLEPGALIAAIDEELNDDNETSSQSSWQTLLPPSSGQQRVGQQRLKSIRVHGKRLTRSKGPCIEIRLSGLNAEVDRYHPGQQLVSRTLVVLKDVEILDHIKTSTWRKFLTELRSDSRGNLRETDSNMVRVELLSVRPVPSDPSEEARLRAKILPLRLYVDQDALDFLKKFFSFKQTDNSASPDPDASGDDIYFQHAEIFPVNIKLDYKPRRVDYRALKEGRTIELMNFFHFDGAEMTLRHLTLSGVTGWPRLFDNLNDLWTPDVKATQLVDVISGVSPIRSFVNVGSGMADLVLLPIAQYKKDGRIVHGVQRGTKAFVKTTAIEAIKLGARLATGTQVILEQAESVLGGQFKDTVTAEAVHMASEDDSEQIGDETAELISRYAEQPSDVREGVKSAYRSLQRNINSAAQTILAVPMEVYERSGNEGAVRAVIRAVPIAVLKPMIGATEAVSKTLMGLHNTLDPDIRHENEAKYKQRE